MSRIRGEKMILGTSDERVRYLKRGVKIKTIEELYIQKNEFKILKSPLLFDFLDTISINVLPPSSVCRIR